MLFGGMMVGKADIARLIGRFQSIGNFIYSAKLFARYLVDRLKYPRGTRLMMGNALDRSAVLQFASSVKCQSCSTRRSSILIGDQNGVTGARLTSGGKEMLVRTRKGVVLATGGYGHNKGFRSAFMPQPVPRIFHEL